MRTPEPAATLPLAYAAEILFELTQLRQECSDAAEGLVNAERLDEEGLEECARLDDAVAHAHRILLSALKSIKTSRNNRRLGPGI